MNYKDYCENCGELIEEQPVRYNGHLICHTCYDRINQACTEASQDLDRHIVAEVAKHLEPDEFQYLYDISAWLISKNKITKKRVMKVLKKLKPVSINKLIKT